MHPVVEQVTARIEARSEAGRSAYLSRIERMARQGPQRASLSCTNLAHGFAAAEPDAKLILRNVEQHANIAIISAYNDILSAHQPYAGYPERLRRTIALTGHVAQFAAGVPAMCDGVTQGQPGMELSLFSRDVIAQATAIALCHNLYDGVLLLGICDKIVPGMLMGALSFGHLPALFVPSGPMPSGLSNKEKARVREAYASGKVSHDELLEAEAAAYHAPGTCTFYGTANSNQILMEVMGLHMPGAAFATPGTALRDALTDAAARQITRITALEGPKAWRPLGHLMSARTLVNALVALLATGGSTNHALHLVAIARVAGYRLDWDDFAELSQVVPLLARVYPNGSADINAFEQAGGVPFLIREALQAGLMFDNVMTVQGESLWDYATQAVLTASGELTWQAPPAVSRDPAVLTDISAPFSPQGGLQRLQGNLGRAIIKVSAVASERWRIAAPARVFASQERFMEAFARDEIQQDAVVVLPWQGPRANGMPELHKLIPLLGVLQDRGLRVALVTDGRLSGASGKVPCAIHLTPEAAAGGAITQICDGDWIEMDAAAGLLQWTPLATVRTPCVPENEGAGYGRELFVAMRRHVTSAEEGAMTFGWHEE